MDRIEQTFWHYHLAFCTNTPCVCAVRVSVRVLVRSTRVALSVRGGVRELGPHVVRVALRGGRA